MLHSSAVVADGKAYLFTADSGTGKSTHTQLWPRMFGDRAYILNDDKPALLDEYEVDEETAKHSVAAFVEKLHENDLLD